MLSDINLSRYKLGVVCGILSQHSKSLLACQETSRVEKGRGWRERRRNGGKEARRERKRKRWEEKRRERQRGEGGGKKVKEIEGERQEEGERQGGREKERGRERKRLGKEGAWSIEREGWKKRERLIKT